MAALTDLTLADLSAAMARNVALPLGSSANAPNASCNGTVSWSTNEMT